MLLYATARLFGEAVGACLRRDDLVDDVVVVHDALAVAETACGSEVDIVLYDVTAGGPLAAVRALTDQLIELPVVGAHRLAERGRRDRLRRRRVGGVGPARLDAR